MRITFLRGWIDGTVTNIGSIAGALVTMNPYMIIAIGLASAFSHSINDFFSYKREFDLDILYSTKRIEELSNLDVEYIRSSPSFLKKKKEYRKKSFVGGFASLLGKLYILIPFFFLPINYAFLSTVILGILGTIVPSFFLGKITKADKYRIAVDMSFSFLVSLSIGLFIVWVYGL